MKCFLLVLLLAVLPPQRLCVCLAKDFETLQYFNVLIRHGRKKLRVFVALRFEGVRWHPDYEI